EKILRWLANLDPFTNQRNASKQHEPGTGNWLLQRDDFLTWRSTPGTVMWLHGIAGCGKTVIWFAFCQSHAAQLVIFYFDFRDPWKQNADGLLLSILAQL
ncbi:uncharacterized protein LY89DRAFT_542673, partial [Mollisia scopiformis]